jgi:hypothetical protein
MITQLVDSEADSKEMGASPQGLLSEQQEYHDVESRKKKTMY